MLGEWINYDSVLNSGKASTSAFWEEHVLHGSEFPITVAHEAAHGIGISDETQAEAYAKSCLK